MSVDAPDPRDPADVVSAFITAFGGRDTDAFLALSDRAIELWAQPTAELTGRESPYRGHAGVREYLADVDRVWTSFEIHPDDVRVAGNGVIAFGRGRGVAAGDGQVVVAALIWVFRVRDDRVAFCRVARTAAEATTLLDA